MKVISPAPLAETVPRLTQPFGLPRSVVASTAAMASGAACALTLICPPESSAMWSSSGDGADGGGVDLKDQKPPSSLNVPPASGPASGWPMVPVTENGPPALVPPPPSMVNQLMLNCACAAVARLNATRIPSNGI